MPLHDEIDHEEASNIHPRWFIDDGETTHLRDYAQVNMINSIILGDGADMIMDVGADFILME